MKTYRENPESSENRKATRENELAVMAAKMERKQPFHPFEENWMLESSPKTLFGKGVYRMFPDASRMDYVSQRLLHAVLVSYLKHHEGNDDIGWNELGDLLHSAICEAIGDDAYCAWLERRKDDHAEGD